MYNITFVILGNRLKQIREQLDLSQGNLAQIVDCKQNAISNLERGKGGSITLLINVLNHFSKYVYIDLIFSEKFYLISTKDHDVAKKGNFTSVVAEIIEEAKLQHLNRMDRFFEDAKEELNANLNKAINLISS